MKKNEKIGLYLCIALFGIIGVFLTFIAGNTNKYDSQTTAHRIDANERTSSDGKMYYPIYYFNVDGIEYKCESKSGSNSWPNENKNQVYYNSENPEECKTQHEKSSSTFMGILCLIVTLILIIITIKKPSTSTSKHNQIKEMDAETKAQIDEKVQKATLMIGTITLIYKRIILGILIAILLIIILVDTVIIKQTIISKDYIETVATFVEKKNDEEDSISADYIYTFEDKNGKQQEIIVSISKDEIAEDKIKIKYNENNPQEYYDDASTFSKTEFIWYIVKIIALILLVILFFNKKALNRVTISASTRK